MATHTIDAGIGTFTANCEENLKLKMFLDSLKDQIELGKLDSIIEFLDDGCDDGSSKLRDEISDLEDEIKNKEEEIASLNSEISELEDKDEIDDEIDGGIGTIGFKTDNLLTQLVMEELGVAIDKTDPLKVLRYLQNI